MKKIVMAAVTMATLFVLSGCDLEYYDDDLTTLFLIDQNGNSYGGVPYRCDSMSGWSRTAPNGEFSFIPPENCEFDFLGFDGTYGNPWKDDIVYIVDDLDFGKGSIPYECTSFGTGRTYGDGSFDYNVDDECVFYL